MVGRVMVYYEYTLGRAQDAPETAFEIATAELAELGFDSFSEEAGELHAYIPEPEYVRLRETIAAWLDEAGYPHTIREIADDTNWNSVWESNFSSVEVDGRCRVRASFHEAAPDFEHEIVITPKMSFGTGHHATT
ncbi:MAG: 50S ribosomal protein L11 methyltransferase, partial [Rikenellaceae bacterium]|nr:50S ribosomal protein L11 methyltransferase [Rikenellaceae bacterium]